MGLVDRLRAQVRRLGYDVVRYPNPDEMSPDLDPGFLGIWEQVRPYTMTSIERGYALYGAVGHITAHDIPGAIVECGVWRGGSMMLAALKLSAAGVTDRDLYLFDTYEGMTPPTAQDRRAVDGKAAAAILADEDRSGRTAWAIADIGDVRSVMALTGYPTERITFIEGRVEDTVPGRAPDEIALLRLDTDWYESTRHELEHLVPRVVNGGVLIIDDYGYWAGARKAVDEFAAATELPLFLQRIDSSGRMAVVHRTLQ